MSTRVMDFSDSSNDDSLDSTGQGWPGNGSVSGSREGCVSGPTLDRHQDDPEAALIADAQSGKAAQGAAVAVAGTLRDIEPDTMTLHTRDAYQMFIGRKHSPGTQDVPIAGGRKFAAVLKSIWYLSGQDNPCADWILIRLSEGLAGLRERLVSATREQEAQIGKLRSKGIVLSVMSSRQPLVVTLGFRSPYGYATAEAVVEFDYYVRVIKTLVHKDRLSEAQGRDAIRVLARGMRGFFLGAVRWERLLYRDELKALSRADFLPGADAAACKRVEAAVRLFGPVPRQILLRETVPRHTRRKARPTEAVLRALHRVGQDRGDDAGHADEVLL